MHFASISLGIFDFLINWLTEFIIWVVGWIFELINTLLARTWFSIGTSFANILDMLQGTFKKLCGMDVYWVGTERVEGVDPLLQMFTNSNVIQILIALSLVAVVMVIIAAIIQVIRIEFTTEGSKNSKGQVFGQALKSLLMFFLVPICCIGGIGITNALLRTIDRATNLSTGSSTLGSTIFVSAATSTNRVRAGGNLTEPLRRLVGINGDINDTNREECAQLVDQWFKDTTVGWDTGLGIFDSGSAFCPYANWEIAFLYYNLYEMNYILYIGAVLIACGIMIHASYGMVMRLIKGVILFMVSPPVVALIPLTNSPFASWRKTFLANVLSAYGTIVGFNLVMMVLPVVNNIKLFQPLTLDGTALGGLTAGMDANGANGLITILVTLTGLFMIKDMIKFLSDMINADDANAIGGPMSKKVGKTVGTMAAVAAAPVALAAAPALAGAGAAMSAKGAAMAGGKFAGFGKVLGKVGSGLTKASNSKVVRSLGNQGSKFLQQGLGNIGKAANSVLGDYTGGLIHPFSEETDVKKAQETRDEKRKARKERIKNGEGTLGDSILDNIINDSGREKLDNFRSGGARGRQKVREEREKNDAIQKATSEYKDGFTPDLSRVIGSEVKIQTDGSITVGAKKGASISEKIWEAGNKGGHDDKNGMYDLVMEVLNTLKNQTEKTAAVQTAIEQATQVSSMITSGQFTAKEVADSSLFKSFGEQIRVVQDEASHKMEIINSGKFDINALLNSDNMEAAIKNQAKEIQSALSTKIKIDESEISKIINDVVKQTKRNIEVALESKKEGK